MGFEDVTKNIFGEDIPGMERPNPSVEIFETVVEKIYDTDDIELKTDLNSAQVVAFSRANVFAKKYGFDILSDLVNELERRSVSLNRKGRKEFENIAKAINGMSQEEERRSIPSRLLGNN